MITFSKNHKAEKKDEVVIDTKTMKLVSVEFDQRTASQNKPMGSGGPILTGRICKFEGSDFTEDAANAVKDELAKGSIVFVNRRQYTQTDMDYYDALNKLFSKLDDDKIITEEIAEMTEDRELICSPT
jgi:hypothetical protein